MFIFYPSDEDHNAAFFKSQEITFFFEKKETIVIHESWQQATSDVCWKWLEAANLKFPGNLMMGIISYFKERYKKNKKNEG